MVTPDIDAGTLDATAQNAPSLDLDTVRSPVIPPVPESNLMQFTDSDDLMEYTGSEDNMEYRG